MANRVEKILKDARITLADPQKQRWSDEVLLTFLNEAQQDFCQQTKILHNRRKVPITLGNPYFTLPKDCWQLTRVLYNDIALPLVTHQELDSPHNMKLPSAGSRWEKTSAAPEAIIYDRRNATEGKIYPLPKIQVETYTFTEIPTDLPDEVVYAKPGITVGVTSYDLSTAYGVVSGTSEEIDEEKEYEDLGVLTKLVKESTATPVAGFGFTDSITTYQSNAIFGLVASLEDETTVDTFGEVFEVFEVFGVVSSIIPPDPFLKCYYLQIPAELKSTDDELMVPLVYDIALKYYVSGQAFLSDIDTGSQQKGGAQLAIYERHVRTAKKDSNRDNARAAQFETIYRSF